MGLLIAGDLQRGKGRRLRPGAFERRRIAGLPVIGIVERAIGIALEGGDLRRCPSGICYPPPGIGRYQISSAVYCPTGPPAWQPRPISPPGNLADSDDLDHEDQ